MLPLELAERECQSRVPLSLSRRGWILLTGVTSTPATDTGVAKSCLTSLYNSFELITPIFTKCTKYPGSRFPKWDDCSGFVAVSPLHHKRGCHQLEGSRCMMILRVQCIKSIC